MILPITEDWRINTDELQWIVQQRKVAGENAKIPGEITWDNKTFHHTLNNAYKSLRQRMIRIHPAETLADVLDAVKGIDGTLSDALRSIENEGAWSQNIRNIKH